MRSRPWRAALAGAACVAPLLVLFAAALPVMGRPRVEPGDALCRWTDLPVTLDGRLDEPAWRRAFPVRGFHQPWARAKTRLAATEARLLWDRDFLYFAAEIDDTDLRASVAEHDGRTWEDDVFELFLKPADDAPGYYEFHVTPRGTVLDMFLPRRGAGGWERYRGEGVFHVEARVALRGAPNDAAPDAGWSVEARIPWRDFMRTGGRPAPGEIWRAAFSRYDYAVGRGPLLSTTAPRASGPAPDFHRYEDFGRVRFEGPETGRPYVPAVTSRVVGSPDPPLPYRVRRAWPGVGFSYAVMAVPVPGSEWWLAIQHKWPGGPSEIVRFRPGAAAGPPAAPPERLFELDRCAYDICFDPDFARNGVLYLSSKGPLAAPSADRKMQVALYRWRADRPDPASERVVLDWPSDGHDGGAMAFGRDGRFYVTTGDGTSDSDTTLAGQDMSRLTAKLLRLDFSQVPGGGTYRVPGDNPFVGRPGVQPETWAYGFRNPWKLCVDPNDGALWVGNNGQDAWESAYRVERGANYGWSIVEGSHPFYLQRERGPTPIVAPTVEHPHSEARSLTGGFVYTGGRHPDLQGAYIYGDYSTGKIWAARHDGSRLTSLREIADTSLQITHFSPGPGGEILILDYRPNGEGAFYALEETPKDAPRPDFPRTLSASGLFSSVRGHRVRESLVPYDVNAPLWSDGAHKARFLALPTADAKIEVMPNRGWNFPDRTVMVKSFALDLREGDPRSRRWIETRFLTRQEGEWVGYSYRWNDEQTEAHLVEAPGEDREFRVRVPRSRENPDGVRVQKWRYPSRAECMTCHTRAANFVLGLSTLQMNRDHEYGGRRVNQIAHLERLGLLRDAGSQPWLDRLRRDARASGLTSDREIDAYVARHGPQPGQRSYRESGLLPEPPSRLPSLADPYDPRQPLDRRARSYLHSNCSGCHVEAGGGNAQMELEFTTPVERMRVLDVPPLHDRFGIDDARLLAPGSPERSVLLRRLQSREKGHMPPLATSRPDEAAVGLFREWIRGLKR